MPYNTATIRSLLQAVFTDEDLNIFCFDYFRPAYDEFTLGMSRSQKIQILLKHCVQGQRLPDLLALLQDLNPQQYERYAGDIHTIHPLPIVTPLTTLATALHRLAQLPTDHVPTPAPLPPGSRMPFAVNPLFVGRKRDLVTLAETLKAHGPTTVINQAAVTGIGGIGKTQLAVEFAHRYGQYFAGGVYWLGFADPAAILTELAACGGPDLAQDFAQLDLDTQVKLVQRAWQLPIPRLLIFDNCEQEELLAAWRPTSGGCRILVTSRRAVWDAELGIQLLPLAVLSRRESLDLLIKHRPGLNEADLGPIAAELGDLPLAIHLAGSYLAVRRHSPLGAPAAYLDHLKQVALNHPSLRQAGFTRATAHDRHVANTFTVSYDDLDPSDAIDTLALSLLARAAHFAPGVPIPRELLLATLHLADDDLEVQDRAEQALVRLTDLGLLEPETEGALLLHRLLARFVEATRPDPVPRTAVEEALLAAVSEREDQIGYIETLPASLLVHLWHAVDIAQPQTDELAGKLCRGLGAYLNQVGDYEGARPFLERVLKITEQMLGAEHPDTATRLNDLGVLLTSLGDYKQARLHLERALRICEKALGSEHPDTVTSLNNLGGLLFNLGEYEAARPLYERALRICQRELGIEHPDTASSLNHLAQLLHAVGDYEGALLHFERALTVSAKLFGEEHPMTATVINDLAQLLHAVGDYEGARLYFEQALSISEKVFGEEHPKTATSINNLGVLLGTQGNYEQARLCHERALSIRERVLGGEHPHTANSLNNLGLLFRDQQNYQEARSFFERALAICEKVMGTDHPTTRLVSRNLASLDQGHSAPSTIQILHP